MKLVIKAVCLVSLALIVTACCGGAGGGSEPLSVEVVTPWPGANALEVEAQVAVPLEVAVMGLAGVLAVRSECAAGLHTMEVVFEAGRAEPLSAVLGAVQGAASSLPDDVESPVGTAPSRIWRTWATWCSPSPTADPSSCATWPTWSWGTTRSWSAWSSTASWRWS